MEFESLAARRFYAMARHGSSAKSHHYRLNGRWPGREWISGFDLAVGVDLLIHDAQYTDEEYERYLGWGHSTYRHAFEFAAQVGAKQIGPFHHDPSHDDEMLDRLPENAV